MKPLHDTITANQNKCTVYTNIEKYQYNFTLVEVTQGDATQIETTTLIYSTWKK